MKQSNSAVGYLPEERPSFIKLLFYGIQQVIVKIGRASCRERV